MTLESILEQGLYVGVTLILFVCGVGVPLPEEGVFLAAGWYGAKHGANVWLLCFCGILGILLGDSIPYWVGRKYGLTVLTKRPFSWFLTEKGIAKTRTFFDKNGSKTVFVGRFVAGLRMPTFFMAGSMRVPYLTFLMWDLAGALISCPTSIWLAYHYGQRAEELIKESRPILFTVLGLIVAYLVYHIWSHRETPDEPVSTTTPNPPNPSE
ncbi:MAG: DedA family protein [Planctomycetota bacterium]